MIELLTAFFVSFFVALLIIYSEDMHRHLSADSDMSGPQKIHHKIVPRIGGIAIISGLSLSILIRAIDTLNANIEIILLICAFITFTIGLIEDITKKLSAGTRLILLLIPGIIFAFTLNYHIERVGIPGFDLLLNIPFLAVFFTVFAITGLTNAYNIIDGFNGLSSMVGLITLLAISYISYMNNDDLLVYLSLAMGCSILGFFLWNYPKGLIFLGDGGAYLIGFWIATLTILLIGRHQELSPWCALLLNGYPIIETLFTIYRRKIHQGKSPGSADGLHIHTLIYRRMLMRGTKCKANVLHANAKTSPFLWTFSILCICPSIFWPNSTNYLIISFFILLALYIALYKKIINFSIKSASNWSSRKITQKNNNNKEDTQLNN